MQIALFIRTTGADQLKIETIREVFFIKCNALIHQRAVAAQQAFAHIAQAATGDQQ
ncbi:hypothetical protein D3C72_1945730 [compost metagenome]